MKLKTNIEKLETQVEEYINHERSASERFGAAVLALATVFSMTNLGRENLSRLPVVILPAAAFSIVIDDAMAGESEVARLPVTLDKGMQTPTISGE